MLWPIGPQLSWGLLLSDSGDDDILTQLTSSLCWDNFTSKNKLFVFVINKWVWNISNQYTTMVLGLPWFQRRAGWGLRREKKEAREKPVGFSGPRSVCRENILEGYLFRQSRGASWTQWLSCLSLLTLSRQWENPFLLCDSAPVTFIY